MGNKLDIPSDGNYTTWWDPMNDRVDKFCSNRAFSAPSGDLGITVFDSLADMDGAAKLESFMVGDSSLGSYIFSKGGMITMLVFGFILLAMCITLCFSLLPGFRKTFSKWFCGACQDRKRKRFEELDRGWKITIIGSATIFIVGCLALGITSIVAASQTIQSTNGFMCNGWLQLRGYYFGTNDSSKADVPDIAWNWKGSLAQLDELTVIQRNVTPGSDNPLLLYINDMYYNTFQVQLNATTDEACGFAASMNKTLLALDHLHHQIPTENVDYTAVLQISSDIMEKCIEFDQVMNDSLKYGYGNMTESIDFYLGPNSSLLNTAYDVATNAIISVGDTNYGIGLLSQSMDSIGSLLGGFMKFTASVAIIIPLISFVLCGVFIYLCFSLMKCYKSDTLPSKRTVSLLKCSYVGWLLLAGFSILTAALTYTFGSIGQDVCYTSYEGLLKDGNWNMLHKLLDKTANGTVDFWGVLDTCLRVDGDGDVASALGLTSSLTGLETLTTLAIQNITSLPDKVLNPPEKKILSQLIRVGFHDVLSWNYRQSIDDDANGYFNDSHYVRPENEVGGYGSWDLVCLVPAYNMEVPGILNECVTDFVYQVASMNQGIDILNSRICPEIHSVDATFPSAFCTPYVQTNMTCADGAVMISSTTPFSQLDDWRQQVETASNKTNGYSFYYVAAGLWDAEVLRDMSLATLVADDGSNATSWVTCPNQNNTDCTFGTYRDAAQAELQLDAPQLPVYVYDILDSVTAFVQDPVLVTINGLLSTAKDALQNFNCQFEGTAMSYGALNSLCVGAMPGMAIMWVLFMVNFFICLLAAWICWKNLHFVMDLAAGFANDMEYAALSTQRQHEQQRALENSAVRAVYAGNAVEEPAKGLLAEAETDSDSSESSTS